MVSERGFGELIEVLCVVLEIAVVMERSAPSTEGLDNTAALPLSRPMNKFLGRLGERSLFNWVVVGFQIFAAARWRPGKDLESDEVAGPTREF